MNFNKMKKILKYKNCYLCGKSKNLKLISTITKKPKKETDFGIYAKEYYREIYFCNNCEVYNNFHTYDLDKLYFGKYNEVTYNNNLIKNFNIIKNLPEHKSDNKQRVKRINEFCKKKGFKPFTTKVLDIGSGLCVFLAELKTLGFNCYCIDPDSSSVEHAIKNVKVDGAFWGNFEDFETNMKFDIITFNKVLEHVKDPLSLLRISQKYINDGGFVYIELPDGDAALKNGEIMKREEFYIEHYTIFTDNSLKFLIKKGDFISSDIGRIHEPSDKYTLYAFFSPKVLL